MTGALQLPSAAVDAIVEDVAAYGMQQLETGGMLLAKRGEIKVTTVAIAGAAGVARGYGRFVLTMPVIDQLFTFAEANGLQVVAHVHSHARGAFLSSIDRAGIIRMTGFIATVIPTFAAPPRDPSLWGWWSFRDGDWLDHIPAVTTDYGPVDVVTVDAKGIR
jgi:hypothetical protein